MGQDVITVLCTYLSLWVLQACEMLKRTVTNEVYKGLVESFNIPVELHERDGKRFASFGSVVPIHCCTPEEVIGIWRVNKLYQRYTSRRL